MKMFLASYVYGDFCYGYIYEKRVGEGLVYLSVRIVL